MAKRSAEKELTDRNWDQEDEAEEMGTFSVASEEVLKNRAIKKAKRSNVGFESDTGGAFKGFKGLVVPSGGGRLSGFGSGAGGKPLEGLSNGNNITSAPPFASAKAAADPKVAFGSLAANGPTTLVDKVSNPKTNGDSQQPSSSGLASSKACVGCKLFYKKDNEFKEKGIGTLHLKPTANQKTQLLVRADTNLGNILLNVLIPPNMPCTRTGKNNVLIVCVPNPPIDEKNATMPVTMLIRVKTSEDADELHKILLEKKDA
uniref:Nuclear pore complex protein Nup50 n=1 Tax=Gorilla gorilla gorilla TaxID=9595 RepID=G3RM91_GORGO